MFVNKRFPIDTGKLWMANFTKKKGEWRVSLNYDVLHSRSTNSGNYEIIDKPLKSAQEIRRINPSFHKQQFKNEGRRIYRENCVRCHGTDAKGRKGVPNLNDDDWLWSETLEDIYEIIRTGIRSDHDETRDNMMPGYGDEKILDQTQIRNVAGYILSLSGRHLPGVDLANGKEVYLQGAECNVCHGEDGKGNVKYAPGAPNLTDNIWLYGGDEKEIIKSIAKGRKGVCPSFEKNLVPDEIKAVSMYVYKLGKKRR